MADQYQGFTNPTIIPEQKYGFQAANQSVQNAGNSIAQYLMQQQQAKQSIQLDQAKTLSQYQNMIQASTGQRNPNIDAILSQNPYGRQMVPQGGGQTSTLQGGQPSMMGGGISTPTNSNVNQSPSMPSMAGGFNANPLGNQFGGAQSQSPVVTSQSQTFSPFGEMGPKTTTSTANPQGEAIVAGNKEYTGKMAGTQALSQENLVRDNTQMMSVFQTLKNLHDIHSALADKNLAGTHLGELGSASLPFVGDAAALFGQKASNLQNKVMLPEDQNLIGNFNSARNEGITRAIQPLQNQVDKTGSSRISESLLKMTEGEYGKLTDTTPAFAGKTLGTAKTLYRITLASQKYADDLAAKGVILGGTDKNFDADDIAKKIYDDANSIELTPAQNAQFNAYANKILGTNGVDYSNNNIKGGSNFNPVANAGTNNQSSAQVFNIGGKTYNIPADKVEAFKKAKGL